MTTNASVRRWVKEVARMCGPADVVWCDGSEAERERLLKVAVRAGDLIPLDQRRLPGCYLHRSDPNDVARTEHLTFICCREKDDAGPTNNWIAPAGAYDRLSKLLSSSMEGRTMYVIPFVMGPPGSHFSKVGIQVTDSVYVVLNMRMMTRMGAVAWEQLGPSDDFTRGLHSTADLSADRRYICHFPEDNTIWSVGSGYGGNALLSKKCMSLRIASHMGHREGWLAEHMLIIGVESPDGEVTYICGAFPSACGKTNLSMLVPPAPCGGRAMTIRRHAPRSTGAAVHGRRRTMSRLPTRTADSRRQGVSAPPSRPSGRTPRGSRSVPSSSARGDKSCCRSSTRPLAGSTAPSWGLR